MTNPVIDLALDEVIAEDYLRSFSEHYEIVNNCIMMLDKAPTDQDVIDEVFRSLHTIKGNADMCQLKALTQFVHKLEDVVSAIRDNHIEYSQVLGEIILLCLDKTREASRDVFAGRPINTVLLQKIQVQLEGFKSADDIRSQETVNQIIGLLTGHIVDTDNNAIVATDAGRPGQKSLFVDTAPETKVSSVMSAPYSKEKLTEQTLQTLQNLQQLTQLLEQKIPFWHGRLERTLPLLMAFNNELAVPVNPVQLEAALYAHDLAFAFLSDALIHKDSKFNDSDLAELHSHPGLSSNLLAFKPEWNLARQIVLQHHEKWDGSGYPNGLKAEQIEIGAQILAIVDTFESITHPRPDRQYKRSVLRAVTEINNCALTQFSPDLIPVFNKVVKTVISRMKK